MSAGVVESVKFAFAVTRDDVFVADDLKSNPVTRVLKAVLVRDQHPLPAENGTSFELKHVLRQVPASWECPNGLGLTIGVGTGTHGAFGLGSGRHDNDVGWVVAEGRKLWRMYRLLQRDISKTDAR